MRRSAHAVATALVGMLMLTALVGLQSCSSSSGSSSTDPNVATPDGSFCSLLIAFRTSNASLETEVNSGDSERTKTAVTRLVSQSDLLRRKAPADIKADATAVAAYVVSLDQLFAQYGYNIDAIIADEAASADFIALTSDEVNSSLLQLRTYAETQCAATPTT